MHSDVTLLTFDPRRRKPARPGWAIGLLVWFAVMVGLSLGGILQKTSSARLLAYGMVIPLCAFTGVWLSSRRFQMWIVTLSLRAITMAQAPRILGGTFLLWMFSNHRLPAAFALPTGISDIVIGAASIQVAMVFIDKRNQPRAGLLTWQILSLVWLLISSFSGMITSPPELGQFPANLIPVFFGPLMILIQTVAIVATAMRKPLS